MAEHTEHANQAIWTVSGITRYLKNKLDVDEILQDVWIRGEISNFTHHSRGHMYFTVKDEECRLKAVMFAGHNRYLKFMPQNGTKVIVRGALTIFERDGQYQFYVKEMQPDGIGNLHLAFEQLKRRLQEEGLFAAERKRPLPLYPRVIGVITSPTGAAVRDVITTIRRRYPVARILLYPVSVQGDGAAPQIAEAIHYMGNHSEADVLIVGRGGGSIEELWAFNEEVVARSIFLCSIPVISAVGHETDFTISDFVADMRAATPTAAAELAVPMLAEIEEHLNELNKQLVKNLRSHATRLRERLQYLRRSYALRQPLSRVEQAEQRFDRLFERMLLAGKRLPAGKKERLRTLEQRLLSTNPQRHAQWMKDKVAGLTRDLMRNARQRVVDQRKTWSYRVSQLDALSPLKIMGRGYSLVYDERRRLVKSVRQVNPGDVIEVAMTDGRLDCQVWGLKEGKMDDAQSKKD